jgi:hypothetical protein
VQITVGAVPGVAPELAVPPEIGSPSLAAQTVVNVNIADVASRATDVWM